jgi:hypothetical protein
MSLAGVVLVALVGLLTGRELLAWRQRRGER